MIGQLHCVLCKAPLNPDAEPGVGYGLNPKTLRKGWMHLYCNRIAVEEVQEDPERYENFLMHEVALPD